MNKFSKPDSTRPDIFVPHAYPEQTVDLGEVTMNYVVSGSDRNPALLLIPAQADSWWIYEDAIPLLDKDFQVFVVDLRGQGRTTWTPRRYTIDTMANDLVRFLSLVVKRPAVVSGCSSGGVIAAWLAAFAMPGQVRGACLEDPPLFSSELNPLYGPGIRQSAGPIWEAFSAHLGDQWSVGDWAGAIAAIDKKYPDIFPADPEPPQGFKEYDPEWARAFYQGTIAQNCPHERMLRQVKVPVLLTHHERSVDSETGMLTGAMTDFQAVKVQELVKSAGQPCDYVSLPDAHHMMHAFDPPRFAEVLGRWTKQLS